MKTLFLTLLTSLTFAQSPFWKMELMENETASSTPDITTGLVALWQNGDTVDITGRGNDLTRSHTNPDPSPAEWNDEYIYATNELCSYYGIVWRSRQDGNQGYSVGENEFWTHHQPYKVSTGLTGIDSAIQFNGIDHYLSRASTTDLQLGGTDFTIAVWVKMPFTDEFSYIIIFKSAEYELLHQYYHYFNANYNEIGADDTWQFVVVRQSGTTNYLSINNGSEASATVEITNGNSKVQVGYGNVIFWAGSIAQLAIYKRALTQEQITYLYNGGDGRLIVP